MTNFFEFSWSIHFWRKLNHEDWLKSSRIFFINAKRYILCKSLQWWCTGAAVTLLSIILPDGASYTLLLDDPRSICNSRKKLIFYREVRHIFSCARHCQHTTQNYQSIKDISYWKWNVVKKVLAKTVQKELHFKSVSVWSD